MTTDIRSRLEDLKARLRELPEQAKQAVENLRKPADPAKPAPKSPEPRCMASDEEVQAALEQFGWHKPPEPRESSHRETAASAPPVRAKTRSEKRVKAPQAQATTVVPSVAEKSAETPPAGTESAGNQDLFGKKLRRDIMREVFTEEDLALLRDENTHVYKKVETVPLETAESSLSPARARRRRRKEAKRLREEQKAQRPQKIFTGRDYRPVRRRRYYRTGLQGGLMYFGFVVCVSVILASVAWLAADDVLSLNKEEIEAQVYVGQNAELDDIATELYSKGLVKYKPLFKLFGKLTHADEKIEPGIYTISSKLDYNAMIHVMKHDEVTYVERDTVTITIPEGKTLKQTFQILAEHGVCPYETLLDCAANHAFKFSFLEDIPYGDATRLEGYLFPDTYQFYASSTPEEAINKFLINFDGKFSESMREKAEQMGYSMHEIVTIASLIEMEAGSDTERGTVASVIYNRLNSSYYPYLQIDATIQYVLEERKEYLTEKDLQVDSPYNTYKYTGIPPGPISNPGLASLRSALNPESTGYYFYALNKNGVHNFFSSYNEFLNFINSDVFGG